MDSAPSRSVLEWQVPLEDRDDLDDVAGRDAVDDAIVAFDDFAEPLEEGRFGHTLPDRRVLRELSARSIS